MLVNASDALRQIVEQHQTRIPNIIELRNRQLGHAIHVNTTLLWSQDVLDGFNAFHMVPMSSDTRIALAYPSTYLQKEAYYTLSRVDCTLSE